MAETLKEQRNALNNILKHEAKGALIRSRFHFAKDIDTSSSFFFNLEKSHSVKKHIYRIRLPFGDVTENPSEIKTCIHSFYQNLYANVDVDVNAQDSLLEDIPSLDPSDVQACDEPISMEELEQAVKQLNTNKTPGLDGLTPEFFKKFWPTIKYDFLSVFNAAFISGALPISCRRAVISLLPKKGDPLDIANWRPISLLNTDYKICLLHANMENLPLAILNLGQKKSYLLKTLGKMGFGDNFLSYIKLLYNNAQSLVKINSSLTSPFPFEKGIRQGCP